MVVEGERRNGREFEGGIGVGGSKRENRKGYACAEWDDHSVHVVRHRM